MPGRSLGFSECSIDVLLLFECSHVRVEALEGVDYDIKRCTRAQTLGMHAAMCSGEGKHSEGFLDSADTKVALSKRTFLSRASLGPRLVVVAPAVGVSPARLILQ
jgi:hypothetical protein